MKPGPKESNDGAPLEGQPSPAKESLVSSPDPKSESPIDSTVGNSAAATETATDALVGTTKKLHKSSQSPQSTEKEKEAQKEDHDTAQDQKPRVEGPGGNRGRAGSSNDRAIDGKAKDDEDSYVNTTSDDIVTTEEDDEEPEKSHIKSEDGGDGDEDDDGNEDEDEEDEERTSEWRSRSVRRGTRKRKPRKLEEESQTSYTRHPRNRRGRERVNYAAFDIDSDDIDEDEEDEIPEIAIPAEESNNAATATVKEEPVAGQPFEYQGVPADKKGPTSSKFSNKPFTASSKPDSTDGLRSVVMQYLHKERKRRRKVFQSVQDASLKTGISDSLLEVVCQEGGGFLGGAWWEYQASQGESEKRSRNFLRGGRFDVAAQLRPLPTSIGQMERNLVNHVIELVCKVTGEVMVCFPSVQAAAAALDITERQVIRACSTYATHEQYAFFSFVLRYQSISPVYMYSSDQADFRHIPETHEQRLARWRIIMSERSQPIKQQPDLIMPPPATSAPRFSQPQSQYQTKKRKSERTSTSTSALDDHRLPMRVDSRYGSVFQQTYDLVQRSPPFFASPKTSDESSCIFCQIRPATVIFEPCGHCLLCTVCIAKTCRLFCPQCRTNIVKRKRSTTSYRGLSVDMSGRLLTVSPYEFMTDDEL